MNRKTSIGVFVLQSKKDNTFFGVRGWSTEKALTQIDPAVVIFHRNTHPNRKTSICQSAWHEELWNRLTKQKSEWKPVPYST